MVLACVARAAAFFGSWRRSQLNLTAAASYGVPSLNLMLGCNLSVQTRASADVRDSAVCGTMVLVLRSLYSSMSYTAEPRIASVLPEFCMVMGSRFTMSPAMNMVMVPPGWMSSRGTVVGAAVTLVMPPVIVLFTPALVDVAVVFLVVVAVFLAVVVDTDPAVDDVGATALVLSVVELTD